MRIHALMHGSRANGPGLRSVLWTQGCSLGCEGCWNRQTWDASGGTEVDPDELAEEIVRESAPGTTGLTLSGGEPMAQALSIYSLMCSVLARRPDWDLGLFSGYNLSELQNGDYACPDLIYGSKWMGQQERRRLLWQHQIREKLTWLIAGRYDRTRPQSSAREDLPYKHCISSANQALWLFRERWAFSDFPALSMEVSIDETGLTNITGFPI